MQSVLNKIFSGKKDSEIHNEFVKFSRGVFNNRYLIEGKKQPDKWNIKTSAEFANFFVRACLGKVNGPVKVKGVIVATFDLSSEAKFKVSGIKQFMGIKQAIVDTEVQPEDVIALMDKYPKAFFALTFSGNEFELKIKPKAPKSAKPASKGEKEEGPKVDFCTLKTNDKQIIDDLFFDVPMFKEIKITHTLQIENITLPKGEKDPVKLRENAIREGKIIREILVDGKQIKKEVKLEA